MLQEVTKEAFLCKENVLLNPKGNETKYQTVQED